MSHPASVPSRTAVHSFGAPGSFTYSTPRPDPRPISTIFSPPATRARTAGQAIERKAALQDITEVKAARMPLPSTLSQCTDQWDAKQKAKLKAEQRAADDKFNLERASFRLQAFKMLIDPHSCALVERLGDMYALVNAWVTAIPGRSFEMTSPVHPIDLHTGQPVTHLWACPRMCVTYTSPVSKTTTSQVFPQSDIRTNHIEASINAFERLISAFVDPRGDWSLPATEGFAVTAGWLALAHRRCRPVDRVLRLKALRALVPEYDFNARPELPTPTHRHPSVAFVTHKETNSEVYHVTMDGEDWDDSLDKAVRFLEDRVMRVERAKAGASSAVEISEPSVPDTHMQEEEIPATPKIAGDTPAAMSDLDGDMPEIDLTAEEIVQRLPGLKAFQEHAEAACDRDQEEH